MSRASPSCRSRDVLTRQRLEPREVVIDRTELVFQHCRALERVAQPEFVGYADASVELDGILPHEAAGLIGWIEKFT